MLEMSEERELQTLARCIVRVFESRMDGKNSGSEEEGDIKEEWNSKEKSKRLETLSWRALQKWHRNCLGGFVNYGVGKGKENGSGTKVPVISVATLNLKSYLKFGL